MMNSDMHKPCDICNAQLDVMSECEYCPTCYETFQLPVTLKPCPMCEGPPCVIVQKGEYPYGKEKYMAINAKFDRYKIPQTLDEVIERAAEHLKEGWNLIINIEKEGCVVTLQDPDMTEFSCDGGDGIRSDINEGICISNGFTSTD